MVQREVRFLYTEFANETELNEADLALLRAAKKELPNAFAPYSKFHVSAAVLLENGEIVVGTNQENAAFPACVCAEVTALSACSSRFPGVAPLGIAIAVESKLKVTKKPAAPCGQCRQTIFEYENRYKNNISILMSATEGVIFKVDSVKDILPLYFSGEDFV